jgi:hypothetical protein
VCDFISWIDVDGKLLYLTDADVKSSHGRHALEDVQDNDVLGHGAIRAYYSMSQYQGVNHERRDFWADDLPDEIKKVVKSGACANMIKLSFEMHDIDYVVRSAPVAVRRQLADYGLTRMYVRNGATYTVVNRQTDLRGGRTEWRYRERQRHGLQRQWNPCGQLRSSCKWVSDQPHGIVKGWHENGQQAYTDRFVHGLKCGVSRDWNRKGQLTRVEHWRDGRRHGETRMWNSDTKQFDVYMYENGKLV